MAKTRKQSGHDEQPSVAKSNGSIVVEAGLKGLKKTFKHPRLQLPKLPKDLLQDPSIMEEILQEKFEDVGQIQRDMTSALKFLWDTQK